MPQAAEEKSIKILQTLNGHASLHFQVTQNTAVPRVRVHAKVVPGASVYVFVDPGILGRKRLRRSLLTPDGRYGGRTPGVVGQFVQVPVFSSRTPAIASTGLLSLLVRLSELCK